jgi:DnaJ like chaperone protein
MGLRGVVFGGILGGLYGKVPGAVFGAYLGHRIEEEILRRRRMRRGRTGGFAPAGGDRLSDAYAELGVEAHMTDAQVRRAYRELAKKYHPDAIRAQGLGEADAAKAAERMKRINQAWSVVKEFRGL